MACNDNAGVQMSSFNPNSLAGLDGGGLDTLDFTLVRLPEVLLSLWMRLARATLREFTRARVMKRCKAIVQITFLELNGARGLTFLGLGGNDVITGGTGNDTLDGELVQIQSLGVEDRYLCATPEMVDQHSPTPIPSLTSRITMTSWEWMD